MSETKKIDNRFYKKVLLSPFINKSSTFSTYLMVLIALVPQVIMLFVTKSFSNLVVISACVAACLCSELFSFIERKNVKLSILMSFLQGILIGFFLPAGYPPISVFFITLISMLILKYAFNDNYSSWISPVVVIVISCWFIGQMNFPDFLITKDFMSAKNPSLVLLQEGIFPTFKFDERITSFLNETTFGLFGVSIPQGYVSLLWDSGSVIPAFRFNFLTILASIFFVAFDVFTFEIPFVYLVTYTLLVKFVSPFFSNGIPMQGDMLLALLSSGTLFCAFFLIQWFGTTPMTKQGKIFYGLLAGLFAFLFSGIGTSPIGSIATVLFANICSPVIQYFENKNKRMKLSNNLRNENA